MLISCPDKKLFTFAMHNWLFTLCSHSLNIYLLFQVCVYIPKPHSKWLIELKTFTTTPHCRWVSYSPSYQMEIIFLAGYKFTKIPRCQCQYLWTLLGNFRQSRVIFCQTTSHLATKPPEPHAVSGGVLKNCKTFARWEMFCLFFVCLFHFLCILHVKSFQRVVILAGIHMNAG